MHWRTTRFVIDLLQPRVVGIVNITPDSFATRSGIDSPSSAIAQAEQQRKNGADILELGAESTRPGATLVDATEEWRRLGVVLKEVVQWGIPICVDTGKAVVMQQALDMGADAINDIWALRQNGAFQVIAKHPSCGVVLMHMHGEPATMQISPIDTQSLRGHAIGVAGFVRDFLTTKTQELNKAQVQKDRIVWDPGIGFGKTVEQNFSLLAATRSLAASGYPVMCAWSRKSSLGAVTELENPADRLPASLAAVLLALERGSRLLRVHDVKETVDVVRVWTALQRQSKFIH